MLSPDYFKVRKNNQGQRLMGGGAGAARGHPLSAPPPGFGGPLAPALGGADIHGPPAAAAGAAGSTNQSDNLVEACGAGAASRPAGVGAPAAGGAVPVPGCYDDRHLLLTPKRRKASAADFF